MQYWALQPLRLGWADMAQDQADMDRLVIFWVTGGSENPVCTTVLRLTLWILTMLFSSNALGSAQQANWPVLAWCRCWGFRRMCLRDLCKPVHRMFVAPRERLPGWERQDFCSSESQLPSRVTFTKDLFAPSPLLKPSQLPRRWKWQLLPVSTSNQ